MFLKSLTGSHLLLCCKVLELCEQRQNLWWRCEHPGGGGGDDDDVGGGGGDDDDPPLLGYGEKRNLWWHWKHPDKLGVMVMMRRRSSSSSSSTSSSSLSSSSSPSSSSSSSSASSQWCFLTGQTWWPRWSGAPYWLPSTDPSTGTWERRPLKVAQKK